MRAADTNIVVRLIAKDDPRQTASAESFVAGGVWISHLVLAESIWVLESNYGLTSVEVLDVLDRISNHSNLALEDADVVAAAIAQYRAKPAVGFSDCLVLEIARKAGHVPVGTFDRDFAKLPDVHRVSR